MTFEFLLQKDGMSFNFNQNLRTKIIEIQQAIKYLRFKQPI